MPNLLLLYYYIIYYYIILYYIQEDFSESLNKILGSVKDNVASFGPFAMNSASGV